MTGLELIAGIFVAVFGLILGSFFNVLIWRLPRDESIVRPASHCPRCNRPIRAIENIPLLSYLFLRGKCAGCKKRISPVYPLIELSTALAALILWNTLAPMKTADWAQTTHLVLQLLALLLLIPVTVIDLRHYIIPDVITLPLAVAALLASFLPGDTTPLTSLAGLLAGSGTLLAIGWLGMIAFRKGDAMGGGDIKLLAAIGALWGPKIALLAIMFGSVFGTLAAMALIVSRRLSRDHHIPFGPWLAAGTWTAVLAGDGIINSYFALVNRLFLNGQ
ncbi:MAG: prepilin peptidase [Chitinispirillaceae bacterium]|nr:prepilin peptidase [Chitinispirillaceae bacterium]